MFSKNITFINFKNKKIKNIKAKTNNLKKYEWLKNYPLLKSFTKSFKYSYSKKDINKYKFYKDFRLIGMGGSILGTEAIYQFLRHKIKKNFYFHNNLIPQIKNLKKMPNIVVSKSGETLETISNFNIILKNKNNKNIIITENTNNYLRRLSNKIKSDIFEHKNYIGGRYSVLSEVGMLPAELMGLNEKNFKKFNYLIKNKRFLENLIINVENIIHYVKKNKKNSIILNYDESSENFFKWYQQLTAESLGKKSKGITPIISSMPKDNHSLLQLYLDGPKNCFFTFFNVTSKTSNKQSNKFILDDKKYLKNKNLSEILEAQEKSTQNIFRKKNIPFRSFKIKKKDENTLGELFCFCVLETILLGHALKVNPLDQPSVELIKTETKRLLSKL
tara:strand:- start:2737 stop:3903 length:1167 start_codon:yes stop_codon:yes gene_type:complete